MFRKPTGWTGYDKYPHCAYLDALGYPYELDYTPHDDPGHWSCRPTEKALTHAVRHPRHSWAPFWNQMQAAKEAKQREAAPA